MDNLTDETLEILELIKAETKTFKFISFTELFLIRRGSAAALGLTLRDLCDSGLLAMQGQDYYIPDTQQSIV